MGLRLEQANKTALIYIFSFSHRFLFEIFDPILFLTLEFSDLSSFAPER